MLPRPSPTRASFVTTWCAGPRAWSGDRADRERLQCPSDSTHEVDASRRYRRGEQARPVPDGGGRGERSPQTVSASRARERGLALGSGLSTSGDLPGKLPTRNGVRRHMVLCIGDVSGAQALSPALDWQIPPHEMRWSRCFSRTRCSTPTRTTRDSNTGSSPMRPATMSRRCLTEPSDGSHRATASSARSGNPGATRPAGPAPAAHDDFSAVVDEHGWTRHVLTADKPNQV